MKGMLLAAGLGTRLRPLTEERPKPAMPFRLRTLGGEGLRALAAAGVLDVVVNAHPLPDVLTRVLAEDAPTETRLRFSYEDEVLGTAGGIHAAYGGSPEPVVVLNGDILYAPSLERAMTLHETERPLATLLVRHVDGSAPGSVDVDPSGQVHGILRDAPPREGLTRLAFTGVQILSPEALAALPARGCVVRDGYVPWLARGERLLACVDDAPFSDLGTPRAYFDAHFGPGHAGEPLISPLSQIEEGARLDASYVGARAHVSGRASLSRCVVWPDAQVPPGEHRGVIITPRGVFSP